MAAVTVDRLELASPSRAEALVFDIAWRPEDRDRGQSSLCARQAGLAERSGQKSFSKLLGQVGQRLLPRIAVRATFALNAGL